MTLLWWVQTCFPGNPREHLEIEEAMTSRPKHRGPHPHDEELFADEEYPRLFEATQDLSWLLSKGYALPSSLKLVGDRYKLEARQRTAVSRSACTDSALANRYQREIPIEKLTGREVWIDGYNLLTTLEAALAGRVILCGRDGCARDVMSMHGNYRKVAETVPAITITGELLERWRVRETRWLLDQPVSNSGRLATLLRETAKQRGWNWSVELVSDPDPILIKCQHVVASADSEILDRATAWTNLARAIIESGIPDARTIDFRGMSAPE